MIVEQLRQKGNNLDKIQVETNKLRMNLMTLLGSNSIRPFKWCLLTSNLFDKNSINDYGSENRCSLS